jgi:hypothetical protein
LVVCAAAVKSVPSCPWTLVKTAVSVVLRVKASPPSVTPAGVASIAAMSFCTAWMSVVYSPRKGFELPLPDRLNRPVDKRIASLKTTPACTRSVE